MQKGGGVLPIYGSDATIKVIMLWCVGEFVCIGVGMDSLVIEMEASIRPQGSKVVQKGLTMKHTVPMQFLSVMPWEPRTFHI